jgi:hypothetical protein
MRGDKVGKLLKDIYYGIWNYNVSCQPSLPRHADNV